MTAAKQEIVEHVEQAPVVQGESAALISVIERAARDPNVDVDKFERLMAMKERVEAANAKKAFNSAIADAKGEIPVIHKNATGHNSKKYADFSAYAKVVDPILAKHGLTYRFRTKQEDKINVTCILSHADGYSEETTLAAAPDTSGNKNAIQAIGSALTYLQRYSLVQALGLAASEDDDGLAFDSAKTLQEWVDELRKVAIEEGMTALGNAWKAKTMPAEVRKALTPALGILKHIAEDGKNEEIEGFEDNYSAGE